MSAYDWGEIGDGWDSLVDPLIKMCSKEGVQIFQIKEKFGGLRFYVYSASDEIHEAILAAERVSHKTCEECGMPGIRRLDRGWIKTLCDVHND